MGMKKESAIRPNVHYLASLTKRLVTFKEANKAIVTSRKSTKS